MAKDYDLHNLTTGDPFSGELRNMPSLDQVEEDFRTYFYITKKGMELLSDDTWWPFDDEGERRPGWYPDAPKSG